MGYGEPHLACPLCGTIGTHSADCPRGGPPATKSAGTGCIGAVGCLVLALAAVAAVLGVLWQVALGVVLPNRGMSDADIAAMEALVDHDWAGYVTCGDSRRGVTIDFERRATKRYDVTAEVTVHRGERPRGAIRDEYELEGSFDDGRLTVTGDEWSAGDAERVDLDGAADGEGTRRIIGTTSNQVSEGGCTGEFRIQR